MTALDGLDFHISRVDRDHEVVVSVQGEVDISTAPQLLEAISAALDGEGKVVLDLAGMTFIDSQGIKVFVEAYKRARPGRASRVVLRSPRAQARMVLELTGLADRLPIED